MEPRQLEDVKRALDALPAVDRESEPESDERGGTALRDDRAR